MEATAGHPRRRGGGGEEDDRVSSLEDVGVAVPPPRHEGGGEMGSRLQDLERWRAGLVDDDGFRDPKLPHGECRALIPPTSNLWYVKGS
jgi:hypothetical protein